MLCRIPRDAHHTKTKELRRRSLKDGGNCSGFDSCVSVSVLQHFHRYCLHHSLRSCSYSCRISGSSNVLGGFILGTEVGSFRSQGIAHHLIHIRHLDSFLETLILYFRAQTVYRTFFACIGRLRSSPLHHNNK